MCACVCSLCVCKCTIVRMRLHAGFELQRIAGEHFTLFEPDAIDSLATALARSLARID